MTRTGLTLLETMVALVVLAIAATALLQVLSRSARTTNELDVWSAAVAFAEDGMEGAKLDASRQLDGASETLAGGFRRRVLRRRVSDRLAIVTVIIEFSDGRSFSLDRLLAVSP